MQGGRLSAAIARCVRACGMGQRIGEEGSRIGQAADLAVKKWDAEGDRRGEAEKGSGGVVVGGRVGGFGAGWCARPCVTLPPVVKRMGGTAGVSLSHLRRRRRPSPYRSFLLHHRICPGSSLLSHRIWGHEASGAEAGECRGGAEAGERRGAAEVGKVTARGPEDSSPPAFSSSSFSLAGVLGRWNGWGPPVCARRSWLCQQNRGSASDVALTRFLGVEIYKR
jgi:hypothetical protein